MTTLMQAVTNNDLATARQLIEAGADVNEPDSGGNAPLITAAYQGHTDMTRLLLENGADVTAVDPGMKATALHAAAYAGRTEPARLLIQHGIDIDKQGPYNGYTALHDAIWQNNIDTAAVIIDAGANLTLTNHNGQTPLDFARAKNAHQIVTLIERKSAG
ncbi:MAG: ankyrin repeat domain-containing protein [Chloroflexi bacterium]|nr:ankyrin repeat domain-containing protein [Chloroflexota bacterium]